jgi:hypothetical protein
MISATHHASIQQIQENFSMTKDFVDGENSHLYTMPLRGI